MTFMISKCDFTLHEYFIFIEVLHAVFKFILLYSHLVHTCCEFMNLLRLNKIIYWHWKIDDFS